jgi:hypothetical protein
MGAVCSKHGLAAAGWAEVEQVATPGGRWPGQVAKARSPTSHPPDLACPQLVLNVPFPPHPTRS